MARVTVSKDNVSVFGAAFCNKEKKINIERNNKIIRCHASMADVITAVGGGATNFHLGLQYPMSLGTEVRSEVQGKAPVWSLGDEVSLKLKHSLHILTAETIRIGKFPHDS